MGPSAASGLGRSWEGKGWTEETVGTMKLTVRRLFEVAVYRCRRGREGSELVGVGRSFG